MEIIRTINAVITAIFILCYAYQFLYIPVAWTGRRREKPKTPAVLHDYAVLICARNEAAVITDLIDSIKRQTYDADRVHVFVMADNCTDDTAARARAAGAAVYTREDRQHVGKGYGLAALMAHLRQDHPDGFDAYLILDADNLLAPDYLEQMNRTFSEGHDIVTGYRNSKNYGDNWISAGYALWFLRDCRYLNHPRYLLHTGGVVSGTGFLFSRRVAEEMGDWPYHTLTEDTEFTADQILRGRRVAYCPGAELFDEQPTSFAQSWRQRLRWSRGYLQVFRRYGIRLFRGILRGNFSCYDFTMSILPAFLLSLLSILCNLVLAVWGAVSGGDIRTVLFSFAEFAGNMYLTLFIVGGITLVTEWRHIRATAGRKILSLFTFPLFMFTYIPVTVAALFCKVEWKPIRHTVSAADFASR